MKKSTIKYLALSSCFSVLLNYTVVKELSNIITINNHEHESDFDIIAHRGFSSKETENTKESVIEANSNMCTSMIEIDVRLTKDNIIVLNHNEDNISNINYDDLSFFKSSSNFEKIMDTLLNYDFTTLLKIYRQLTKQPGQLITLQETIELVNKPLIIDIKFNGDDEEFIEELFKVVNNYNKEIIFQSTNKEALSKMREKNPYYFYYHIIGNNKVLNEIDLTFDGYTIKNTILTKKWVEYLNNHNKEILVWTINNESQIRKIKSQLGEKIKKVKIITDYPDCMCVLEKVR